MALEEAPRVRVHRFAMISGIGWSMDICLMALLVWQGLPTFLANLCSATLAITFVFLASQQNIFIHDGILLGRKFLFYCLWQGCAVPAASLAIHITVTLLRPLDLAGLGIRLLPTMPIVPSVGLIDALVAKGSVTPLTLYANYLFMGWLLEKRVSWR